MSNLETLRHSTSHVLAHAVRELYPDVKLGIGPAIEDGFYYDFDKKEPFTPNDLLKIEKKMQEIINKNFHFRKFIKTKAEAKKLLQKEPYKLELLKDLKEKKATFYQHNNFIDLCKGPHINSTGQIKAFKLLNVAGAYWKGDVKRPMLQRIYGTAFPTKKELEKFLQLKEEAEKRNHIKLGKQLDLFSIHEEGPGFPFWHPKGMILYNELIKFWKQEHQKANYVEVKTPFILNKKLWEQSGHWDHYKEFMYFTKIDNQDFAIKPMNCPGGILIYKTKIHSYKEFPLRVAELGLVHRHELSGVLNGLFRVRCFTQDDAHIYCTPEQIEDEVVNIIKLTSSIYKIFNLPYRVELSTRPKSSIGTVKMWNVAEKSLKGALKKAKLNYKLNPGEGAFYGPKIDFHVKDALERTWQCGTIQLDFAMPEKFNLTYEGKDGRKHTPVMLHRTILGSIERFVGILIEHYAAKFPLWLAPTQIKILTITDKNIAYAKKLKEKFEQNKLRVELNDKPESMPKKVRDAQLEQIPLMLTIGNKEMQNNTVAIRTLDGKVHFNIKTEKFVKDTLKQIQDKK